MLVLGQRGKLKGRRRRRLEKNERKSEWRGDERETLYVYVYGARGAKIIFYTRPRRLRLFRTLRLR